MNARTGKLVGAPDQSFANDFAAGEVKGDGAIAALSKLGSLVFLEIGAPGMSPLKSAFRQANGGDSKRSWVCALEDGIDWKAIATTVAKLHTAGVTIDWRAMDAKYEFNFLQLPTYPFQRERFWLDSVGVVGSGGFSDDSVQGLAVTKAISDVINPVLGQQLSSPFMDDVIFVSHCSCVTMPVLEDHIINDLCIVPAVFQVGMALEAAVHLAGGRTTQTLQDLVIPAALLLKGMASKSVQLVLKPVDDDENVLEFELNSIGDGADQTLKGSWQTHCSGRMRTDNKTAIGNTHETPESIKRRCDIEHTLPEFYKFMWEREYELGPMFQLIQHIWRNDREAISKLSRYTDADALTAETTCLYPVYFDCCIQNCMAIVAWDTPLDIFKTYVPLGCGTFNLYKSSMGKDLWCHTDLSKSAGAGRLDEMDVITGDLFLIDSDGDVVAEAINFRVKRAGKELLMNSLKEDLTSWFYNIDWNAAELTEPTGGETGTALLFADAVVAPQLAQKLRAAGETVVLVTPGSSYRASGTAVTMDPQNPAHYAQLFADSLWGGVPPCTKILHMWAVDSCTDADSSAAELEAATKAGTYSALHLTQALAAWSHTPRLYLVTQGTQPVADAAGLAVAQAPLWGYGKVVGLEFPQFQPTRVDLDLFDVGSAADQLFAEVTGGSPEEEVGFRGGDRFVSRLVQRKKDKGGGLKVDPSGSYMVRAPHNMDYPPKIWPGSPRITVKCALWASNGSNHLGLCALQVTGGFGGLGLIVAEFLVDHGATRLILTSRRGQPEWAGPQVAALEAKGATVVAGKADVADEASLRKLFDDAIAAGAPVRGVLHSAGVLDDKKLVDMDVASFEKVMASKVAGARNLHALTKDTDHDMFVLFSSATSAIGNAGQSNYAAANAYLDGLAHHRQVRRGLQLLSLWRIPTAAVS